MRQTWQMKGRFRLTPDLEHAPFKMTLTVQSPVVFAYNGGDRYAGLNGGVKCAFLKGE